MTTSSKNASLVMAAILALSLGLAACGGGGGNGLVTDGGGMITEPEPDPQALANAINLVASWAQDDDGASIGGWWWRSFNNSGNQEPLSHTHRYGSNAAPVVSYDEDGPQFNVTLFQNSDADPLQTDPWAQAHRYVATYEFDNNPEGVTTSRKVITDHDLGPEWHVEKLTKNYGNAGTLSVGIATDVESSDGAVDQWKTQAGRVENISLEGAPDLPPDRDFLIVWIGADDTINGSLDGAEGSFACAWGDGCLFVRDRGELGFSTFGGVSFTPADGTAQGVASISPGTTTAADWLAFGYWLYVPVDVKDADDYDFGVFASGGDPFEATHLAGLTGSATYAGSASGWYYVDESSSDPASGQFTASVALTADFGDETDTGTVTGTLSGFDWPDAMASSLPSMVSLTSANWVGNTRRYGLDYTGDADEVVSGESNIFDMPWENNASAFNGGHALGYTYVDVEGAEWVGEWSAAFFGNGASSTIHPTSIAGTFHSASNNGTAAFTGSFGAHKQDDQK